MNDNPADSVSEAMIHPVDTHVGKMIRRMRWQKGITQQQLGDAVGVKFQQIQKYETGFNRVSASRLWNIGEVLGVPIEYFFEGLAESKQADIPDMMAEKKAIELVRFYHTIPKAQRRRLFDLVRTLAKSPT